MVISAWIYTLIPAAAAIIGAAVAVNVRPGPTLVSAIQHFAAGVVFAAAAGEILPDIMHRASPWATMIGGGIGVATMLLVKHLEALAKGPAGLLTVIGIDILIDGLVLGIGFAAGPKVGLLLTIALTIEVLFLGLTRWPRNSARAFAPVPGSSGSRPRSCSCCRSGPCLERRWRCCPTLF